VSPRLRLVLLSFLMLFVELALIRWIGSNVVYLSYFSNFILLGSFLGIGVGFLRSDADRNLFRWAPVTLAFLVAFVTVFNVRLDRSGSDLLFFGALEATGLPIWVVLPIIFVAVAAVMAMIGEEVARTFAEFEPLEAYRLDISGSILGIAAFAALSFTGAPPVAWGAIVGGLMLVLVRSGWRALQVAAVVGLLVILGRESILPFNSWSPYYKIQVSRDPNVPEAYHFAVNGIPHQEAAPAEVRRTQQPIYFVPYERAKADSPGDVLIIGAGTGSDVSTALAAGARHVDAVEIDPRLQQLGVELHPDHPYDDPRVEVFIDDGRAFLEQTDRRYDLILFALPDSLTLVSGQSSLRLESYLFTEEAMAAARDRLKPGGEFAMYNFYREQWLVDRLAGTLQTVYKHAPCLDTVGEVGKLAVMTIGQTATSVTCPTTWTASGEVPPPATDDYPFLYLRERGIPVLYLTAILLILVASLVLVRAAGVRLFAIRGYLDLFFMGMAFLLLETKSVVQFALLFGTTWFVNALVFAGILASVLAAIEVTRRARLPRSAYLYAALLMAVLIGWLIQPHALLSLPLVPRFVAAVLIWFAPIFVANLVFAQRFRDVGASRVAFGANLLGAMVGGLLEYAALVTGYQTLALLVAALYLCAYATGEHGPFRVWQPRLLGVGASRG
jgi:SAM-dependent methyltransferase